MLLELDGAGALNRQVYRAVLAAISCGQLRHGERLWSSRTLQQRLGVSRNVVLMALAQLTAEGHLEARHGSGTYVSARASAVAPSRRASAPARALQGTGAQLAAQPRFDIGGAYAQAMGHDLRFDFRYGRTLVPAATQLDWLRIARQTSRFTFQRCSPMGHPQLQQALAGYLRRMRGVVVAAEDVLITSGAQEALDLTIRLLVRRRATVLVEDPHYRPFSMLALAHGARIRALSVDEQGLCTDQLPNRRCALAYVTPNHQFPTGQVLALARRHALLRWAERFDTLLVEDDYDGEYRFDSGPLPPLKQLDTTDRVIHVGSMSKVLSPALRLGYAVLPGGLMPHYAGLKELSTGAASVQAQLTLARFIQQGWFERHVRRVRRSYAERRAVLTAAIERHLQGVARYGGSCAGLHLLLWIDAVRATQWREFLQHASRWRIAVFAATSLFAKPPHSLPLMLSYGGIETADIEPGIRALRQVIRTFADEHG